MTLTELVETMRSSLAPQTWFQAKPTPEFREIYEEAVEYCRRESLWQDYEDLSGTINEDGDMRGQADQLMVAIYQMNSYVGSLEGTDKHPRALGALQALAHLAKEMVDAGS